MSRFNLAVSFYEFNSPVALAGIWGTDMGVYRDSKDKMQNVGHEKIYFFVMEYYFLLTLKDEYMLGVIIGYYT